MYCEYSQPGNGLVIMEWEGFIMAKKKLSFEDSVRRLDEMAKDLESGDLPLEESLAFL